MNKLSRNFVGALRTTPTNCRVSFIDLYSVFPRNFRIVFSPHTHTVVLLERYTAVLSQSLGYLWQTLSALYPKVRLSPWRQARENIHSGPRVPPELYSTHPRWGPLLVPRSSSRRGDMGLLIRTFVQVVQVAWLPMVVGKYYHQNCAHYFRLVFSV